MTIIARFNKRRAQAQPKYKAGDVVYLTRNMQWPAGTPLKIVNSTGWVRNPAKDVSYEVEFPTIPHGHVLEEDMTQQKPAFHIGDDVEIVNSAGKVLPTQAEITAMNGYDESKNEWFYNVFHSGQVTAFPESALKLVKQLAVGDVVEIVNGTTAFKAGDLGYVTAYDPKGDMYNVDITGHGFHRWFNSADIKLHSSPKFKIGDEVIYVNRNGDEDVDKVSKANYDKSFHEWYYFLGSDRNMSYPEKNLSPATNYKKKQKFQVGDLVKLLIDFNRSFYPNIPKGTMGTITQIKPSGGILADFGPDYGSVSEVFLDESQIRLVGAPEKPSVPSTAPQPAQPAQPQTKPQLPFQQRMDDVLKRLQVSPTDKRTKKEYEDLLIEQQEEEMKNVVAKMKQRKKR